MLGITLGVMDVLELVKYDGSEIGSSECSTDGTADGKFEGLLLLVQLGSVVGLEFGRVIGTTVVVLDGIILVTYVVIESRTSV